MRIYADLGCAMLPIPVVVTILILLLVGISMNGLVVFILGFRIQRNSHTTYLLHLSIFDTLFVVFCGVLIFRTFVRSISRVILLITALGMFSAYYVSPFFLALISLHHCLSIAAPLWVKLYKPPWFTWVSSLVIWLLAGTLFTLSAICDYGCNNHVLRNLFILSVNIIGFFLPLLLIVICNLVILIKLRSRARAHSGTLYRSISLTTLAFFLCGFPHNTLDLIRFFHPPENLHVEAINLSSSIFFCFLVLNPCLNPFIYICTGRNLWEMFKESLHANLQRVFGEEQLNDGRPQENPPENNLSTTSV
ncbi:proto-oncogene Mas-like [Latimeria chalumnae]|uniref:proto-oncogene Mas-like n=1 Tax=Latimeria chalumnae TaxID=7897 RepID=UPI00313AB1DC